MQLDYYFKWKILLNKGNKFSFPEKSLIDFATNLLDFDNIGKSNHLIKLLYSQ